MYRGTENFYEHMFANVLYSSGLLSGVLDVAIYEAGNDLVV